MSHQTFIDLQPKVGSFRYFFSEFQTHIRLAAIIPNGVTENSASEIIIIRDFRWKSHCWGLFKLPTAAVL